MGKSEDTIWLSWTLELYLHSFQYTADSHDTSSNWKMYFHEVHWCTGVDKGKGFFLLAIFLLYFARQHPGDAHAVQLCTGFSVLALVLHGLSCPCKSSRGLSEDPQFRGGSYMAVLSSDKLGCSCHGALLALLSRGLVKTQTNYDKIFQLTCTLKWTTDAGMACNVLSKPKNIPKPGWSFPPNCYLSFSFWETSNDWCSSISYAIQPAF